MSATQLAFSEHLFSHGVNVVGTGKVCAFVSKLCFVIFFVLVGAVSKPVVGARVSSKFSEISVFVNSFFGATVGGSSVALIVTGPFEVISGAVVVATFDSVVASRGPLVAVVVAARSSSIVVVLP